MSSNTDTESSASDESAESDDQRDLEARVRDLEVDVYGYDSDECSAGRQAVVDIKRTVMFLDNRSDEDGAPVEDVYRVAEVIGINRELAEQAYQKLRRQGEVYEREPGVAKPT